MRNHLADDLINFICILKIPEHHFARGRKKKISCFLDVETEVMERRGISTRFPKLFTPYMRLLVTVRLIFQYFRKCRMPQINIRMLS